MHRRRDSFIREILENDRIDAHQRKNGNQQRRNAPIIIPSVLAALCSARQLFVCCRIEVPETHTNTPN